MSAVIEFFGRTHPAWVHLPIGFLILAVVFQWMGNSEKYAVLLPAVRISYLLGMTGAILSCISGLILSSSGEYDASLLGFHQWFGIAVAVCAVGGYWQSRQPNTLVRNMLAGVILLLLLITGHLGSTLTRGEGYLTKGLFADSTANKKTTAHKIGNVQEAVVFSDIIQPMLDDKCGTCHSAAKQKGGLRLDGKEWILKGGKDGPVFTQGNANTSDLYKRIVLDPLEEKHMPPKGKPQLTEREINLLHWWINSNAGFDKKVKETEQPANITAALQSLQQHASTTPQVAAIPQEPVEEISPAILNQLHNAGITVVPVAAGSHYLLANFISIPKPADSTVALLQQINKQLIWLKLNYANLSAASWKIIGECINLTRLSIDHTNINDADLLQLNKLQKLQYLNLTGTAITIEGVKQLKNLGALQQLYLGQTKIAAKEMASLQQQFPHASIDSGNYQVNTLAGDTQTLKFKAVKK